MKIIPLASDYDRDSFDCGEVELNDYLKKFAGQHGRKGQSRTFILVEENSPRIWGYYTLSSASLAFDIIPENVPRHPVPVALMGRLAVDREKRGHGLGAVLLVDALKRVVTLAEQIGIYALVVDALHAPAKNFYLHYGFRELLDDPLHLFLPLRIAKQLIEAK
jgi:GNAT superfamily N-acetyltransferase